MCMYDLGLGLGCLSFECFSSVISSHFFPCPFSVSEQLMPVERQGRVVASPDSLVLHIPIFDGTSYYFLLRVAFT